jgi:hypothetical protein
MRQNKKTGRNGRDFVFASYALKLPPSVSMLAENSKTSSVWFSDDRTRHK